MGFNTGQALAFNERVHSLEGQAPKTTEEEFEVIFQRKGKLSRGNRMPRQPTVTNSGKDFDALWIRLKEELDRLSI